MAYISTEYYTRLEQARAPHPSQEVLAALARALRLSDAEREHLHHLAGTPALRSAGPSREVRPSILDLLDRLPQAAATVTSATFEILAWNDLAAALMEDFSVLPRRDRNLLRRVFLGPHAHGQRLYGVSDVEAFTRTATQRLRAAAARYPGQPDVAELVAELLDGSDDFARLWESHDASAERTMCKTFQHRLVGPVTVNCDVLDITDRDQQLVIYTAAPGSPSAEKLRLLSVIGTQHMDVSH